MKGRGGSGALFCARPAHRRSCATAGLPGASGRSDRRRKLCFNVDRAHASPPPNVQQGFHMSALQDDADRVDPHHSRLSEAGRRFSVTSRRFSAMRARSAAPSTNSSTPMQAAKVDKVAGIEARGFILGGAIAHQLSAGFVPIRKKGKLPHETVRIAYSLEYGVDEMEMHRDAVTPGEKGHPRRRPDRHGRHGGGGGEALAAVRRRDRRGLLHHRPAGSRRQPQARRPSACPSAR